jgi:hypothetical protein
MKKTHRLRNFLVLWALILVIALSYYVYDRTDVFIIEYPSIIGTLRIQDYEILEMLDSGKRLHYFESNQYDISEQLKHHPMVLECEVQKTFPNEMTIHIIERIPIAALYYSDSFLLIDEELVVVEVTETAGGYYPINGFEFQSFLEGQKINVDNELLLKRTIDLVFLLEYYEFDTRPILEIKNNEMILHFSDEFKALLGNGENLETRFNEMTRIYETMIVDGNARGTIIANHNGPATLKPFGD